MTKYLFTHFDRVVCQKNCKTTREKSMIFQEVLPITFEVGESIRLFFDGKELPQSYSIKDYDSDSAIVDAINCGYFNYFLSAKGYKVFIIT